MAVTKTSGFAAAIVLLGCLGCNVHVDHDKARIDTPFGEVHAEAKDRLNPEAAGIPVYPGALRDHDNAGGASVDIGDQQFSVMAASFTTSDSPQQVRDFYHERLPHWIFTSKHGHDTEIEMSKNGYKRIVAINERHGRTHIGIVSFGKPGIN